MKPETNRTKVMLSSSSVELILSSSQRCGWLRSTISAVFPLTSFIFSPHRVRAAKKMQIGTLSSLVEGEFQKGTVPTIATSWCWKACGCWLHWERKKKQETWVGLASLYVLLPAERGSQWIGKLIPHAGISMQLCKAWTSLSLHVCCYCCKDDLL